MNRSRIASALCRGLAVVLFAGVAAVATGAVLAAEGSPTAGHPMIGAEAPPFELKSAGGDPMALRDLRGQYVVIHFGASW